MIPSGRRSWRLAELADALGAAYRGAGDMPVDGVADLVAAEPNELAGLFDGRLLNSALASRAGVLVVPEALAERFAARALIPSRVARATFARAAALLHPVPRPAGGVHATAVVAATARLGAEVFVGALAYVGERVQVGARSVIGPGAVLMDEVELGEDVWIHPRVVIYPRCSIGDRSIVFAGAVIGSPGFGQTKDEAGRAVRVPHLGVVVIESDVEIGANTTIDRATFGETRLGSRARLDNLVQIGHNARVGADAMIAAQSGLAGSAELGAGAMVGGQSGLADHVVVGRDAGVAAKSAVFADVEPRTVVAGVPAIPLARWRRIVAIQARLPELWRKRESRGASGREGDEL